MSIQVRDAVAADEAAWRRLWSGYLTFYNEPLADSITDRTWARIIDPANPLFARVAVRDGAIVGFANCVLHEGTWGTTPVCYLEDLYVDADVRGGGIGSALLDDLLRLREERGWHYLYWVTHLNNHTARRLYDRYVQADNFVRYRIGV
jgi:GNAT superfamily N-acetyltransferase